MIPSIFAELAGLLVTLLLAGDTLGVSNDFLPYTAPREGNTNLYHRPKSILKSYINRLNRPIFIDVKGSFIALT